MLLCLACYVPQTSSAHEGRPVFVQLKAVGQVAASGSGYEVQWKIPPVMAAGLEPDISLVAGACKELQLQPGVTMQQKLVGKKLYRCAQDPASIVIVISYPQANPALSSLVVAYDRHGNSQHIYSAPEKTRIEVPSEASALAVARQYIAGGIEHILLGYDHLLFVLCLMVLAGSIPRMLVTVTGFTLAHSVTLVLSTLNLIAVPVMLVELLIALSIVLLAAEIVRPNPPGTKKSLSWRYPFVVASAFGLLHGFGFASVLGELGLPPAMKISALLFFNLGIELGQFLFIVVSLLSVFALKAIFKQALLQQRLVTAGIYLVGVTASYWLIQRFLLIV